MLNITAYLRGPVAVFEQSTFQTNFSYLLFGSGLGKALHIEFVTFKRSSEELHYGAGPLVATKTPLSHKNVSYCLLSCPVQTSNTGASSFLFSG